MIRADLWLPDPDGVLAPGAFGAGALIRLERSDDLGENYAEITTIEILAGTIQYQYWDADGDATSLYRWLVSDADDEIQSPYSAPFAGTNPAANVLPLAYATIDQAIAHFESAPVGARLVRLGTLLGVATQQVNEALRPRGDYFRHPSDGTETWALDTLRQSTVVHCHDGLVAVETVEISTDRGDTYTELPSTEWEVRGSNPWSTQRIPTDEPYFHVFLNGTGRRSFPAGVKAVRLTGARGWATIPPALVEATAQRARQLMEAEASYSGSAAGGLDQFGRPATTDRFWPQSLYNFMEAEKSRFRACVSAGDMTTPPARWVHW